MNIGMQHFPQEQSKELASMGLVGTRAFLSETACSDNEQAPITAGLFRMEVGNPLGYTYSYDECKLLLDGELTLAEKGKGGATVTLRPGDVVFFSSGMTVMFSTASSGTVFYVGQRELGEL